MTILYKMLANKKGHHEIGITPYLAVFSIFGFAAMNLKLNLQKVWR